MADCQQQGCLEKAISFCGCQSISLMCEYHLKDHIQNNIHSKHSFKFFHSKIYSETVQTIENFIKIMTGGLESYNKKLISAQKHATAKLSNGLSQSMKVIEFSRAIWLTSIRAVFSPENDIFSHLILSSSTKLEVIESFTKYLIKNSFNPELIYKKINWINQKQSKTENLIVEIWITEKRIKELLASWSNSPLLPFKISFIHQDDSKMHWDKANILKADIEKIDKNYRRVVTNYSSSDSLRASSELSLKILKKNYEEFLNIKILFCQTLAQKEIYLSQSEKILNLYWKENINTLAMISFDPKTQKICLDTSIIGTNDDWPSFGISSSVITLPNSEILCYTVCDRYKSFITNSINKKRFIIGSLCSQGWIHEGLVYFENNIFVFGGYAAFSLSRTARKYDLKLNKWEVLVPLPKPASSCSCLVNKQKILLSGRDNTSLYQYDIIINSYSVILNGLSKNNKLLFRSDSKVYIIEGYGGIYESEKDNEYKFTMIKNPVTCNGYGQNSWISRNGSIYYSMWNENYGINYYSFNLKTKKIMLIKELIWNTYFS
ncbi:unnamed protein product [Blepharisma stoltei]|uniref:Uncharacterized protein n=1 Tax=Blepharisma stoltei TaxID=1481888 RepID=A0AAU9K2A8_9CILI|nr:unnamed protein product [Blepharisma stoltei]